MPFSGRKTELARLREVLKANDASLIVVYGRRRVGKTSLVLEAFRSSRILRFEGLEEQSTSEQIRNFIEQLQLQMPGNEIMEVSTWRKALMQLLPLLKDGDVLFFDEFQWMANYRHALVSDLKLFWELHFTKKNITLVLCGSVASFMKNKVLHSRALYGRCDVEINLQPMKLSEVKGMIPGSSPREIIETYLHVGGVPKYIEWISRHSSVYLAIEDLAFRKNGSLVEEYGKIFLSHFGRNADYRRIIDALAAKPYGILRRDIAKAAGTGEGGQLTKVLNDLEAATFIAAQKPFFRKGNSKEIRYILSDPYLRLYFSLIRPNMEAINSGQQRLFIDCIHTSGYKSWLGRSFELLCMNHAHEIADVLRFSSVRYRCGPYFRSRTGGQTGVQIDLLFDRADNVITLCEMKYSEMPVGIGVLDDMRKKMDALRAFGKTIYPVLITRTEPTSEVRKRNFIRHVVRDLDLMK